MFVDRVRRADQLTMFSWPDDGNRTIAFFSPTEMPHSYEHIVDAQQSSDGDELYNLTQLAEVSIVYFRHHTGAIVDGPSAYEKVIKVRAPHASCQKSSHVVHVVGYLATRNRSTGR